MPSPNAGCGRSIRSGIPPLIDGGGTGGATDGTVVIDCFPEAIDRYGYADAIVAVDVLRASTTAVTAAALGRQCLPVVDIDQARWYRSVIDDAVLGGEVRGVVPDDFDLPNSPAAIAARTDIERPLVLLSSDGTRVMRAGMQLTTTYVACLRNVAAQAEELIRKHGRVVLVGAGSRGEFREEDQYGCALLARSLLDAGFQAGNAATTEVVSRWADQPPEAILVSNSVRFLARTGQLADAGFVLDHIDDLDSVFVMDQGGLRAVAAGAGGPALGLIA